MHLNGTHFIFFGKIRQLSKSFNYSVRFLKSCTLIGCRDCTSPSSNFSTQPWQLKSMALSRSWMAVQPAVIAAMIVMVVVRVITPLPLLLLPAGQACSCSQVLLESDRE